MIASNITRLQYEYKEIISNSTPYYSVGLENPLDWYNWNILLYGPVDTPYSEGIFKVKMTIPKEYPFKAPLVTWITPIFHPQINKQKEEDPGNLCLRVISHNGEWNPAMKLKDSYYYKYHNYNFFKVIIDLFTLLSKPTKNLFVTIPGVMFQKDPTMFEEKAKEMTKKYAC